MLHFANENKFLFGILSILLFLEGFSSCRADKGGFPENFAEYGDSEKISYMIENCVPDSVARFICDSYLGKCDDIIILDFPESVRFAASRYTGSSLNDFSVTLSRRVCELSPEEKVRIYLAAGEKDLQRLGFKIGSDYVEGLQTGEYSQNDVAVELREFSKILRQDSVKLCRFSNGMKIAFYDPTHNDNDLSESIKEELLKNLAIY